MSDQCDNCNGTGYVREGYDGESPCEFCNHDNFVDWLRGELRLANMEVAAQKFKTEAKQAEINTLKYQLLTVEMCATALHEELRRIAVSAPETFSSGGHSDCVWIAKKALGWVK